MRRHSVAVILAAALPLCGFGSCSKVEKPDLPKVVYVPVERTVAVPAPLTARCPVKRAAARTIESVVSAYNANVLSLEQCNSQLGAIEKLAPANEQKQVKP
ncbi:hypothetical protein [Stenotrophomonas maltophilia]|uniref:Rz1-like lysis system protein LysC n=1 Tax=Stenotrophomonas maltophilia TaxID=40324 RepID=UPI00200C1F1A|nr:hypothetical protein [Stenotrophomonas maltophilia]UQA69551.1 hypothetical protein K1516_16660 [Stenotrophomonas maltophilia]HDS1228093.1 hypothetical protein [Stenotrophomonas maltophilia]